MVVERAPMHRSLAKVMLCLSLLLVLALAGCAQPSERSRSLALGLEPGARRQSAESTGSVPRSLLQRAPLTPVSDPDERFDAAVALEEAAKVTSFGVRSAGSDAEKNAAEYIERRLQDFGYQPQIRTFVLPNGKTSRNVIASIDGYASNRTLILGAHIDSKPPSPGANDNGTGVGILLELARLLKKNPAAGRIEFVFFGAEEIIDESRPDGHHFGSREHAAGLTRKQRDDTAGMISIDMVGYGSRFHVQTMRRGPQTMSDMLLDVARELGMSLTFKKDLGRTGWSDHEAYESLGIPAAWLNWQQDPLYHTAGDTVGHLQTIPVERTGRLVLTTIRGLDEVELERLCDR